MTAKSLRAPTRGRVRDIAPPASLNAIIADLRDRIIANRLDVPAPQGEPAELGAIVTVIERRCEDAHARGNEPHHLDPTIASDAREQFLAIAAWAVAGVLELDRRVVADRRRNPA
jgi:hypothetical protein